MITLGFYYLEGIFILFPQNEGGILFLLVLKEKAQTELLKEIQESTHGRAPWRILIIFL